LKNKWVTEEKKKKKKKKKKNPHVSGGIKGKIVILGGFFAEFSRSLPI